MRSYKTFATTVISFTVGCDYVPECSHKQLLSQRQQWRCDTADLFGSYIADKNHCSPVASRRKRESVVYWYSFSNPVRVSAFFLRIILMPFDLWKVLADDGAIYMCTYTCMHACMYACMHAYTGIHTCIHTYIHTGDDISPELEGATCWR